MRSSSLKQTTIAAVVKAIGAKTEIYITDELRIGRQQAGTIDASSPPPVGCKRTVSASASTAFEEPARFLKFHRGQTDNLIQQERFWRRLATNALSKVPCRLNRKAAQFSSAGRLPNQCRDNAGYASDLTFQCHNGAHHDTKSSAQLTDLATIERRSDASGALPQ